MENKNRLIYIMFAEDDMESLIKFYNHLSPLKQTGVNIWHKGLIRPGEDVELVDKDKISSANLILLLVSVDFIKEKNQKVQELLNKNIPLVPIILNDCLWKVTNFKHLKVLPSNGVAINNWENFDQACTNVAESIGSLEKEISLNGTESISADMESTRSWLQDQVVMQQNMMGIKSKKELPLKDLVWGIFMIVLWGVLLLVVHPFFDKMNGGTLFIDIFVTMISLDFLFNTVVKYTMNETAQKSLSLDKSRIAYYIFYFAIAFEVWGPQVYGTVLFSFIIMGFAVAVFIYLYDR